MSRYRGLTCAELVELVTAHLDGGLGAADADRFEAHLVLCPACLAHVHQMRSTVELTGRLREADLSPDLAGALLAAFRGWRPATA